MILTESCKLWGLHYRNLLPISRVCIEGEKPMGILAYMNWGNLRLFLWQCQLVEAHNPQAVSQQDLVHMTVQIAWGMSYLSSRGVIHQDVAVGNCIAEDTLQVKIADNAVSRDLFPMDYVIAWGTMKTGGFGGRPLKVWLIMSSPVPVTCGPSEWCCGS